MSTFDEDDEDKTAISQLAPGFIKAETTVESLPSLVQYNGTAVGKRYVIENEQVTIGRSAEANITVVEASVSRLHAKILKVKAKVLIEDNNSANGLFVNDEKVHGQVALSDQDIIRMGDVLLKYFSSSNIDSFIQDKIYRMATIDAGTEIFNKQYILDTLEYEIKAAQSRRRPIALIYYDLDHFKKVNDTYGHNAGDLILKESAQIVKSVIRKEEIFGRFGGEEFIIILPNSDGKFACELAERVRSAIESHKFMVNIRDSSGKDQQLALKQTFSLGVAEFDASTMQTPKDLLEAADKKLYLSKSNGRNQVSF